LINAGSDSPIIRVLVVDDSSFMRKSITYILESDESIEVVDTAVNGKEGLKKIKHLKPDVVLLDIEMPIMDGFTTLANIMKKFPTPVLMLSGVGKNDAKIAIKSLEYGAVDFLLKPSGVISYDIDKLRDELVTKVKVAAGVNISNISYSLPKKSGQYQSITKKEIVLIGASTGGPRAISEILSGFPSNISAAVIIIQHMSQEFVPYFVEELLKNCSLNISIAQEKEIIKPGQVLVAPGNYNIKVVKNGKSKKIRLSYDILPDVCVPSIDYAMETASEVYGEKAVGVILTGLGSDGANGLKAIKMAGGITIVEDKSTCLVFGMPRAAIELGYIDKIVPLFNIAQTILNYYK